MGEEQGGVCLCLYVGIYRRLSANAQRLCGMKVCGGCWNLIERGFVGVPKR